MHLKETNKISTRYLSENAPANVSNQAGPPVSSGPVVDVPWLNNESFQKLRPNIIPRFSWRLSVRSCMILYRVRNTMCTAPLRFWPEQWLNREKYFP